MELTKEYFDQTIADLATKKDLENLATKEEIEEFAAMVQRGFADLTKQLDVREQLAEHEREIYKIKTVVGLS